MNERNAAAQARNAGSKGSGLIGLYGNIYWQQGFTLIEAMMVVAIVAILAAVALPSYQQYVIRSRLTEAQSALTGFGIAMQQYYQDNRNYVVPVVGAGTSVGPCTTAGSTVTSIPGPSTNFINFTYFCISTATTYTVTATAPSTSVAAGTIYTLDQDGTQRTVSPPTGWTAPTNDCWVRSPTGAC